MQPGLDEVGGRRLQRASGCAIQHVDADLQAARIADVRGLSLERVQELIDDATDRRFIGFFGEPGVNVLELNLSLDEESAR